MATRIQLNFPGLRLDDYDRVCEQLNFPSDWPDGLLVHGSTEVDERLQIVDIWESSGHFDRFVEQRLGSAINQALADRAEMPQRDDEELHTFYTR